MLVSEMTHDDIADWAAMRLKRMGYQLTFSNMTSLTDGEQPDVLGINACNKCFLIEVKVSRSDFKADQKKRWRTQISGLGNYRAYLVPEGLVDLSEIPYGWQLWEIYGTNKPRLRIVKGKDKRPDPSSEIQKKRWTYVGGMDVREYHLYRDIDYAKDLSGWMNKLLRRMDVNGVDVNKFANGYQNGQPISLN